jgi:hypothetical protein
MQRPERIMPPRANQARADDHIGRLRRPERRPVFTVPRTPLLLVVLMLLMTAMRGQMVEAVFTPRNRAELQGDGTNNGGGLFQCIGQCEQSLINAGGEDSYCYSLADGPWESGSGTCTTYADMDVPPGQGDGTHGPITSWNTEKVTNMANSECTTTDIPVFVDLSSLSLSL